MRLIEQELPNGTLRLLIKRNESVLSITPKEGRTVFLQRYDYASSAWAERDFETIKTAMTKAEEVQEVSA